MNSGSCLLSISATLKFWSKKKLIINQINFKMLNINHFYHLFGPSKKLDLAFEPKLNTSTQIFKSPLLALAPKSLHLWASSQRTNLKLEFLPLENHYSIVKNQLWNHKDSTISLKKGLCILVAKEPSIALNPI